ncbi:molybdopterin molybdotransferase MoeA [Kribbella caucasensis]|nr:molybdopterin molybdotransferase MoeA [Kribbella sp. VKM Ac-2527]
MRRRHAAAALPWDAARELAHAAAAPLKCRPQPLADTYGCTLATPLVAPAPVPPVDRAAMDGYAVSGAGPWRLVGVVSASSGQAAPLADGEACAIVTGAAIPTGTTAVLPDEEALLPSSDTVSGEVSPGRHIRRAGEECVAGEVLLPAGVVVQPGVLGLAATLGLDRLTVIPQPRVASLVTGDELVHRGPSGPGRVRDAIGPMLPGLIGQAGAIALPVVHLPDSRRDLVNALTDTQADLILVSGSSASGPADHLRPALAELGGELIIDGVACRPGHPQALARFDDGRLVLGLPGNPLAALTAFLTLGAAALHRLRGLPLPTLPIAPVPGGLACHPDSTRLVPVRVGPQGVVPVGHGGSAMLRGVASADALAVVDPGPAEAIAARLLFLGRV